jgi:hypothetical protein
LLRNAEIFLNIAFLILGLAFPNKKNAVASLLFPKNIQYLTSNPEKTKMLSCSLCSSCSCKRLYVVNHYIVKGHPLSGSEAHEVCHEVIPSPVKEEGN